jgi:hypothetical protein
MKGTVVSVNLSTMQYGSREENIKVFKLQRFLHANPTPTDATMQELLDTTQQIKKYNISKQPQNHIQLDIGGVVGDTHFSPIREIEEDGESEFKLTPIRVLVSDFTTSPFHVSNQLNGDVFEIGQKVKLFDHNHLKTNTK